MAVSASTQQEEQEKHTISLIGLLMYMFLSKLSDVVEAS